ncbi:MAG: hypothetical protein M1825_005001 [Sarcosagium campestre]|nr:MAG: hypothetical protein M1825_005001 [Sarcosagium campestre]
MARSSIIVVSASAALLLLTIFQLLAVYGLPQLDFLRMHRVFDNSNDFSDQTPLGAPDSLHEHLDEGASYILGVGKADVTGPVVEVNLMGYADPKQTGEGVRQRLYSRAFIIEESGRPGASFIYLVLDTQSGDTAVRHGILEGLATLGGEFSRYGSHNVAVTGTHSHSGPGAWLNYLLPQITSKGFSKQSYRAIVDGALLSIKRAHESRVLGSITYGAINISNANVNRSPFAYLANPKSERHRYGEDVDKTLSLLRFQRKSDGKAIGILTWFAVHGTSMHGNNTLITGDNKGVAAYLFEKSMRQNEDAAPGFVAGFSQANVGDTSPNTLGAWCEDGSGLPCGFKDSLCGGKNEPCHGRGPLFREDSVGERSCFEIGKKQYEGARKLFDSLDDIGTPIQRGTVSSFHTFRDFSNFTFALANGTSVSTCPAALGYSFAAGTSDGPGAFDFKQHNPGDPDANPVWNVVGGFLHAPTESQKQCHAPKPILLDVGEVKRPYAWTPNVVDIQLLRVGQLIIIVSPGEATTMSGRRWREAIKSKADETFLLKDESIVVLGGPANSYSHYITTEEEYAVQRYEGASTLYGPHTLNAYINATSDLLHYLDDDSSRPPPGPQPPINTNASLNFISSVVFDRPGFGQAFGDVTSQDYASSRLKTAQFQAANPRNNLRLEGTYAAVERYVKGSWERVRDDSDWSLSFRWQRSSTLLGTSTATLTWEIEDDTEPGRYRFHYYGDSKAPVTGAISPFEGIGDSFIVRS